jgi:hypothetical protein
MRGSVLFRAVVAAVVLTGAAAAGASAGPDPTAPDAEQIFEHARHAWGTGAYPRYVAYSTVVDYSDNGKPVTRTWDTLEDLRHAAVFSRKFSREEEATPFVPHGINIAIPIIGTLNKQQESDPLGHVAFAVDEDYGLAPNERRFTTVQWGTDVDALAGKLTIIGRTGVVARDYDVWLIDTATDAHGATYHLGLRPLTDPWHHRLTELWVDGQTWQPLRATVTGIGNRPPLTKVSWRIDFTQLEGGTYIARETALAPLDYGRAGTLRDTTIAFHQLQFGVRPEQLGYQFGFGADDDQPQGEP